MTDYDDHCKPLPARRRAGWQAEPAPEGKMAQRWIDLAAEYDAYIVGGYAEQDGELLYNSSILVGPDGCIGTHRKVHLWNEEKLWFEPGVVRLCRPRRYRAWAAVPLP